MAKQTPDTEAHAGLRLRESDERLAGRSRVASGALVLVLLAVSVFAVWSSQATSIAAGGAVAASDLSDHYAQASRAVGAEESLERKYRLEPGPQIRAFYNAAAGDLVSALGRVRQQGDAGDQCSWTASWHSTAATSKRSIGCSPRSTGARRPPCS